jgi:hypothetical protein
MQLNFLYSAHQRRVKFSKFLFNPKVSVDMWKCVVESALPQDCPFRHILDIPHLARQPQVKWQSQLILHHALAHKKYLAMLGREIIVKSSDVQPRHKTISTFRCSYLSVAFKSKLLV